MSIRIQKVLSDQGAFCIAEFFHGEEIMHAKVYKPLDWLLEKIVEKKDLIIELDYDKIIGHRVIPDFNDFDSLIKQVENGYLIRGRIHQIMELEKDTVVDLYIQTGAEFIAILASDLQAKAEVNQGLEILVKALRFYPTDI